MSRVQRYQFPLSNRAYGFPRGERRRRKPTVIACVHITGNRNTARMPEGIGSGSGTRAEVAYMARPGNPGGNSAHSYAARNGDMLDCIPWDTYAAWNNGALRRPNTALASVRRIVANEKRLGSRYNPNEEFWWEVEATGYPGSFPLTKAQLDTIAQRIARISIAKGIAISRNTVLLHADLDGVNRLNCPFSAKSREKQAKALVALAKTYRKRFTTPTPVPEPAPEPEPTPTEPDDVAELREALAVAQGQNDELTADVARLSDAISASVSVLEAALEPEEPKGDVDV